MNIEVGKEYLLTFIKTSSDLRPASHLPQIVRVTRINRMETKICFKFIKSGVNTAMLDLSKLTLKSFEVDINELEKL